MNAPRFLPWLRQGLANGIGGVDSATGGALPLHASIKAKVGLGDSEGNEADVEVPFTLAGPGNVVGLDHGQIVRMVPTDGAIDVASNLFPFVELVAPDLPWLLTPATATGDNQLRPWLVLVCVETGDGVTFVPGTDPLPLLTVAGDQVGAQLPDLTESWAWAHVQSMVPAPQMEAELKSGTGAVTARMICPRHLRPGRAYRAALVPAFNAGMMAGRGEDVTELTDLQPAWDISREQPVELPVYATWTFTTSELAADFEELAKRLQPDMDGARLGYQSTRLTGTSLLPDFAGEPTFEYAGPLVDPGSKPQQLKGRERTWFRDGLTPLLDQSADRRVVPRRPQKGYEPAVDDPVVAPPLYGSWPVDRYTVPSSGWMNELNLEPGQRAAAGLGAAVVRTHQHTYLAAAWDQVGEMRALNDELNRARLAVEIGRSHARKLNTMDDSGLIQATGRLQTFVPDQRITASQRVVRSAVVPTAMVSPVYARQTRRSSLVAKRSGRSRRGPSIGLRSLDRFVAASVTHTDRPAELEPVARFGASFVGTETITSKTTFATVAISDSPGTDRTEVVAVEAPLVVKSTAQDDLSGLAAKVSDALDPMWVTVAGLNQRVSGISFDPDKDLPTRVPIGPRFPDPLFSKVRAMGTELILPGVDQLSIDRVRLVEVNRGWIAAFCAGANHEWAREALWNEFPADLSATSFSTFWPRVPKAPDLNRDMHEWTPLTATSLDDVVGDGDASAVLVIRGEVIRRYPDTEFFLVAPDDNGDLLDADNNLPAERTCWPSFIGRLDRETAVVGFDLSAAQVLDKEMFVGVQEPVTGPQFGLDTAATGGPDAYGALPPRWDDLSWANLAASESALDGLTHIRFADAPWLDAELDGLVWPRNSAHLAAITFQQPYRLLLPAKYLIVSEG